MQIRAQLGRFLGGLLAANSGDIRLCGMNTPSTGHQRAVRIGTVEEDLQHYKNDLVRRKISKETSRKWLSAVGLFVSAKGIQSSVEIRSGDISEHLADQMRDRNWSAKTHDNHLDGLRDFCAFLVERNRLEVNAAERVRRANREKTTYGLDKTGMRAYTLAEQRAIVDVARVQCSPRRLRGEHLANRDWCYIFFGLSGLRWLEVSKVPWSDCYVDEKPYKIVCSAKWTKSKRWSEIPLNDEAAAVLRAQREHSGGHRSGLVWPKMPNRHTLDADMARASVEKIDGRGRSAAFHSFRKGLNSLARHLKLDPEIRRQLLRHTRLELTLGTYSDVVEEEMRDGVDRLPALGKSLEEISTPIPHFVPDEEMDLTKCGHVSDDLGDASGEFQSPNRTARQARVLPSTRACVTRSSLQGSGLRAVRPSQAGQPMPREEARGYPLNGAGGIRTPVPEQSRRRVYACVPSINLGVTDRDGQRAVTPSRR